MSSHPTSHGHPRSSRQAVRGRGRLLQGDPASASCRWSIFALSTVWAAWLLHDETKRVTEGHRRRPPSPLKIHQEEIGIVDQVPFSVDRRLPRWRKEHDARLNGYGWVDKSKGIAHIPIERAMEAIASGALPGRSAQVMRSLRMFAAVAGSRPSPPGQAPRAPRSRRSCSRRGAEQPLSALQDIDVIEHLGDRVPAGLAFTDVARQAGPAGLAVRPRQAGAGDARLPPLPDAVRAGARRPGQGGGKLRPQAREGLPRGRRQHRSRRRRQAADRHPAARAGAGRRRRDRRRLAVLDVRGRRRRGRARSSPTPSAFVTSTTRPASSSRTTRSRSC